MTPEEKAEDLVDRMLGLDMDDPTRFDYIDVEAAKHFSLIAVDEILLALKYDMNSPTNGSIKYWNKVKQKIEKL